MSWFGVKVLRKAVVGESTSEEDLYSEDVIIVLADDIEAASRRARELAQQMCSEYRNVYGELVSWRLEQVFDPFGIEDLEPRDGLEVYSRYFYLREGREVSPSEMPD
jgi:hypothetical protein